MQQFYLQTLRDLLEAGLISTSYRVLVTCGGTVDQQALEAAGFRDVVISNVDTRLKGDEFAPFAWSYQDAERLNFADGAFDLVVAHSGLHHCRSPHRALLEFEPRDGLLVRCGVRLGIGQEYEVAAVVANGGEYGGVENSAVPNYIYRWTPREVEKTIQSYAPHARHMYRYFYALRAPRSATGMRRGSWRLPVTRTLDFLLPRFARVFPALANNMGFFIGKPDPAKDLQPWLQRSEGSLRLDQRYAAEHFGGGR
jgi:hypothetical protein